jgi:hypothetical protein
MDNVLTTRKTRKKGKADDSKYEDIIHAMLMKDDGDDDGDGSG